MSPLSDISPLTPTIGIFGDSNSLCVNLTATHKPGTGNPVGAFCKTNSNCLYGLCTLGVCEAPPLTCPSSIAGIVSINHLQRERFDVAAFIPLTSRYPHYPIRKALSVLGMACVHTGILLGTPSRPVRYSTAPALLHVSAAVTSVAMTAL
jgi:hypothetical protein